MDEIDPPSNVEESDLLPDIGDENDEESGELKEQDINDVVLYTLDWSVQSLLERIGKTFDINPTFQRRDAWDQQRKSLYIESLMTGLPVPQIVLAEDKHVRGQFIVLDGKQRLVTMKRFAAPTAEFRSFRLKNLQFLHRLDGKNFEEISGSPEFSSYADNFHAQPVRTIVVRNWVRPEVLYHIFVRLNQGSVSLSPQELRQALYPGLFTRWIDTRSAGSEPIRAARRLKQVDFRMRDAEMLLRFVALKSGLESYGSSLRSFLDEACIYGNREFQLREADFEGLAMECDTAIGRVLDIFGDDSFLRFEGGKYIRRFNIALFDALTLVFSDSLTGSITSGQAEEIIAAYKSLCTENDDFQRSIVSTTKTRYATHARAYYIGEIVSRVVGVDLAIMSRLDKPTFADRG
jgi:hypothetical protein